jgi:hypothetical protein
MKETKAEYSPKKYSVSSDLTGGNFTKGFRRSKTRANTLSFNYKILRGVLLQAARQRQQQR